MQKLLHAAQCDGGLVCRVFQLQQSLKIRRGLTSAQIHTLTIHSIQPAIQSIHWHRRKNYFSVVNASVQTCSNIASHQCKPKPHLLFEFRDEYDKTWKLRLFLIKRNKTYTFICKVLLCESTFMLWLIPAIDDRQHVWAVIPWWHHQTCRGQICSITDTVIVEAEQTVHTVRHPRDSITLKEQLRHHLSAVKRVTGRLGDHHRVIHMTLRT